MHYLPLAPRFFAILVGFFFIVLILRSVRYAYESLGVYHGDDCGHYDGHEDRHRDAEAGNGSGHPMDHHRDDVALGNYRRRRGFALHHFSPLSLPSSVAHIDCQASLSG
jgi:hypothetical protein